MNICTFFHSTHCKEIYGKSRGLCIPCGVIQGCVISKDASFKTSGLKITCTMAGDSEDVIMYSWEIKRRALEL